MKCPNCGAEIGSNSVCEYCGSQVTADTRGGQVRTDKAGCPKCGSTNISFNRETRAEIRNKNSSTILRATVGVCNDCGHTWEVGDNDNTKQQNSNTVWWVLGWIFMFPVPLMILIWRKKNTWDIKVKIAVTAAFWLVFILIANAGKTDRNTPTRTSPTAATHETAATAEKSAVTLKTEDEKSVDDTAEEKPVGPTIAEQVLLDDADLKITATGLKDSLLGKELSLLIENDSDKDITVLARNASVNGYMAATVMSAQVRAGKKANAGLTFQAARLKECGIKEIATMEFYFHIVDPDTWNDIMDTEVYKIETSAAGTYVQEYDDSGEVLVDANNIRIINMGLLASDSVLGPGVVLYIENNSDRNITIQTRDSSVNGFMMNASMSEDVAAGKKAVSSATFFKSNLEDNGITDINEIELYFHIFDQGSWDTVFDSEPVKMEF